MFDPLADDRVDAEHLAIEDRVRAHAEAQEAQSSAAAVMMGQHLGTSTHDFAQMVAIAHAEHFASTPLGAPPLDYRPDANRPCR